MTSRFNPHPTRRLGAIRLLVLTFPCHPCFNPHPTRRLGAIYLRSTSRLSLFQSSPNPKVGCHIVDLRIVPELFQSSPNPKVGCHRMTAVSLGSFNPHPTRRLGAILTAYVTHDSCSAVSILTQPEGWVPCHVSILTQPEGWVPLAYLEKIRNYSLFQSSPNPKVGCHLTVSSADLKRFVFQSSPNPKVGCHLT